MEVRSIDKGLIPIWHKGSTDEENYNFLERYINDLTILRDSNLEISDKALIMLSLNKSGRTDLLQNIDLSLLDRIDSFVEFIENAFGRSKMDLRAQLEEIKRGNSESAFSFLNRLVRLYFRCHQRPPMTITELSLSPDSAHERQEILYHFLRGLGNKRVEQEIRLRMGTDLTFNELPSFSKKLFEVFGNQPVVNSVTDNLQDFHSGDQNQYYSDDEEVGHNESSFRGRCYECGSVGHKAYNCPATDQE